MKRRAPANGRERNGERGAIAIMMALTLTMLMGFAALGFDLSYVRLARLEMKNASDAAAHAAILRLRATGDTNISWQAGAAIAAQNTVLGQPMVLVQNDFTFGSWDSIAQSFSTATPYTAVKINGVRDVSDTGGYVNLTFGRVLGWTSVSTTQDTIGAFANRNFMIEMDITPSYFCTIDAAVQADLALLTQLHTQNVGGDKISLDVFTGMASQFNDFMNIRDNYTAIYELWAGGTDSPPTGYTSFMPGGKTSGITVCNKLDDIPGLGGSQLCGATNYTYPNNPNIIHCSAGGATAPLYTGVTTLYAGTDIGAAIKAGATKLINETHTWEPRILIIVTDGAPETCTAPGGGNNCSAGVNPCCADGFCNVANAVASGHQYRIDACNAAHAILNDAANDADYAMNNNIDLFMIKMTGTSTDNGATFAKTLIRNKGTFQWITDGTGLTTAYTTILGQVPISLVK